MVSFGLTVFVVPTTISKKIIAGTPSFKSRNIQSDGYDWFNRYETDYGGSIVVPRDSPGAS